MVFDPRRHHRRSIRLPDYDYGLPGTYFVTIISANRECLFSHATFRSIAERCWLAVPPHFRDAALDAWVVMPNHFHGLVAIGSGLDTSYNHGSAAQSSHLQTRSLGTIIGNFKSVTARRINRVRRTPRGAVWQRNYYERIVRNERELQRIREYIAANPARWTLDRENPQREDLPDEWKADEDLWFGPP